MKHIRRLIRQPSQISSQLIKRFMKLVQSILTNGDEVSSPALNEKLQQVYVIPCLVDILKFFFDDIEQIQMTFIYDALKLLN